MNVKKTKISEVKLNPNNPRLIKDDKFKKLVQSIKDFPEMLDIRPIVVNADMVILGGNMRFKACKEAGLKEVPIIIADNLTEEQQREFLIKDNTSGGEWDFEMLANEWDVDQLDEWGLEVPSFEADVHLEAEEDDFDTTPPEEPKTVLGDLYEIGEHRLLCGDSTDSDVVAKLMNGSKADMVFTDPPYLMDFKGNVSWDEKKGAQQTFNAVHGGILNDKMSKSDGDDFLDAINSNIILFCKGAFYITFYRLGIDKYFDSLNRVGLQCRSLIIWNKLNHTLSNSDYMSRYEPIFYGWVNEHNFYGGNNGMDIWDIDRTKKNELHPTMKPIPLIEKALNDGSKLNDIVLDLFGGSGSTMVGSHQLKRKGFLMELDPKYCDVIVKRMIKLDDTLTIKLNGVDVTKDWK
ncbi:COG0863 DNA modification methylase [uncultured Caudovirales phage]|uniref:COG0863 DNA modification methylase n=1 Tax=uncultured Caudovirales phage TaxID=2100421 RepID=A0A6J5N281_9CAUD|nr:COG0863 DNA modification methylase [uncultured Caudovirales phage]